ARVRFNLALAIAESGRHQIWSAGTLVPVLIKLARRDGADPWSQTAILSAISHDRALGRYDMPLLRALATDPAADVAFVARLAQPAAQRNGRESDSASLFKDLTTQSPPTARSFIIAEHLAQGLVRETAGAGGHARALRFGEQHKAAFQAVKEIALREQGPV